MLFGKCEKCEYFESIPPFQSGECRRYPQSVPKHAKDGCGEFKQCLDVYSKDLLQEHYNMRDRLKKLGKHEVLECMENDYLKQYAAKNKILSNDEIGKHDE